MKKIAILNDIHGNLFLLNKALDYLKSKDIDLYLIGGDFLTDGPDSNKIIELIRSLPSIIINGNRELSMLSYKLSPIFDNIKCYPMFYTFNTLTNSNLDFLNSLEIFKILSIEGLKICISHGTPYDVRDLVYFNSYDIFDRLINDYNADIYFFAHTHEAFHIVYKNKHFINTGAINVCNKQALSSLFGILTIDNDISFEQITLPYSFSEIKKYYLLSDYYKKCSIWCNVILQSIRTGFDYVLDFSTSYNESISYEDNFKNFMQKNHFDIIKEDTDGY